MATTKAYELSQLGNKLTVTNNMITLKGTVHSQYAGFDSDFTDHITAADTGDLDEGTNLYYTNARADARAQAKIDALVDAAPGSLDTLNELAAALGDDANFSTTITNSVAAKLPLAGGAMTGAITTNSTFDGRNVSVDGAKLDGIEAAADVTDTTNVVAALTAGSNITIAADGTIAGSASYTHPNHSGEVTSTADGATVIANNVVDEANLKVSNTPTNGYFLSAQSGNTGGLTWATVPAGYTDSDAIAAFTAGTNVSIAANGTISATDTNTTYSVGDGGLTEKNFTTADNTKLDGIETGATADQTAAEILTAIKTVDGAGSGLDADLLDGQSGAYYTGYTDTAVANLVDTAPSTLDTLNELAAALGDDANFSTTVTTSIGTKLPLAGGTLTGNLSFGDGDKAIFGAGSDLSIYHDGSNSHIQDNGTGNLVINGTEVRILSDDTSEYSGRFITDGAVELSFNGNKKFETTNTGIDVTGGITADGLTASASTADYIASITNNNGTNAGAGLKVQTRWNTGSNSVLNLLSNSGSNTVANFAGNGDISFYEDTGTTPKFFWDASAESLGIGTASPSELLTLSSADPRLNFIDTNSTASGATTLVEFEGSNGRAGYAGMVSGDLYLHTDTLSAGEIIFRPNNSEAMRIDSSGNVGIGTSSPSTKFHVYGGNSGTGIDIATFRSATGAFNIKCSDLSASNPTWTLRTFSGEPLAFGQGTDERMRIDSSGNLIVGGTTDSAASSITLQNDGDIRGVLASGAGGDTLISAISGVSNGYQIVVDTSNNQTYKWHNGGTQSMTLDSSGNLLVGHTLADVDTLVDNNTVGITLKSNGEILASSLATVATLERENSDGDLIEFRKDGATVGNISVATSGKLQLIGTNQNLQLGSGNVVRLSLDNSHLYPATHNAIDLGFNSSTAFRNLFLAGNITVGGTVDGRDVATDGTKLDTIETNATADQTAAEILTAIKTVDGSGTGLDADLLDGQHGSYYTGYTDTAVANLVASAPGTLDTLNELAAALGDDASFSTTVTTSIAAKLPLAGGTMTGNLTAPNIGIGTTSITDANWGSGNKELAIDGTTGYGIIHLRGTGSGSTDTRFSQGVGDGKFYMAYDDVTNSHRITVESNGTVTIPGSITVGGTVDGVDIATRDGVLTTTTTTANAALPKAGGTMTGDTIVNNYGIGNVGLYSALKYQAVWSMGNAYKQAADGSSLSNLYGISYTHTNIGGQSKSGLSHQALFVENGVTKSAIGTGMWTSGVITTTSNIVVGGTVDGVDIATRDGVLTTTTTTANAALPKAGGAMTGSTTISGNNHMTFGPNSTWGSSIRIGGNGRAATGTEMASVATTDGNLHLDAAASTNAIYLNYYAGTGGVNFGSGASATVATMSSAGNLTLAGTVDGRDVATDGAKLDTIATSANNYSFPYTVSQSEGANTVVQRTSAGYLNAYYFNGTGTFATSANASGMGRFTGTNGTDTYGRSYTAAAARTLLNVADGANNYSLPATPSVTGINIGSQVNLAESTDRADLLQITGSTATWAGLQIRNTSNEGRWSFMTDGESAGIYNDEDDQWHVYFTEGAGTNLYYAGSAAAFTTSTGFTINGSLALTGTGNVTLTGTVDGRDVAADGAKLDGIEAGATAGSAGLPLSGGTMTGAINLNNIGMTNANNISGINDGNTYIKWTGSDAIRIFTGSNQKLEVNNTVITASVYISAPYFEATSDIKLKTNIKKIVSPLKMISNLNGYTFNWKDSGKASAGVIAQEVEKVLPSAVSENEEGSKSVNYNELIGVLIEAVKEQQVQIDNLKAMLGNN